MYIFGRNAVLEALEMQMPVKKVILSSTLKEFAKLSETVQRFAPHIQIERVPKRSIESLAGEIRSGGVCAVLQDVKPFTSIESMVSKLKNRHELPFLIAVDEIQDPRNFGAIIRSAVGAGFHGVVYQKRRQVNITGAVAAASAGAYFKISLCEVVNIPRTLKQLKHHGFWIYGTDSGNYVSLYDVSFNIPLVLVIGSEGKGIRRLVRDSCDEIITIPLHSSLESLNASVASAVIMFEIMRRMVHNE